MNQESIASACFEALDAPRDSSDDLVPFKLRAFGADGRVDLGPTVAQFWPKDTKSTVTALGDAEAQRRAGAFSRMIGAAETIFVLTMTGAQYETFSDQDGPVPPS